MDTYMKPLLQLSRFLISIRKPIATMRKACPIHSKLRKLFTVLWSWTDLGRRVTWKIIGNKLELHKWATQYRMRTRQKSGHHRHHAPQINFNFGTNRNICLQFCVVVYCLFFQFEYRFGSICGDHFVIICRDTCTLTRQWI